MDDNRSVPYLKAPARCEAPLVELASHWRNRNKRREREILMVMMMMMKIKKKKNKSVICMLLVLLLAVNYATEAESACTRHCGGVDIPFPFGIEDGCFVTDFKVNCTGSKLYHGDIQLVGIDLNNSTATVLQPIATVCLPHIPKMAVTPKNNVLAPTGMNLTGSPFQLTDSQFHLADSPFHFSDSGNIFAAIGCDAAAFFTATLTSDIEDSSDFNTGGCVSHCSNNPKGICSSNDGCCQTVIPPGAVQFKFFTDSYSGESSSNNSSNNSCYYSFVVDRYWFYENWSSNPPGADFSERHQGQVPVVVDWSCSDHACPHPSRRSLKYIFMIISAAAGGCFLIFVVVDTLRRWLKKRNLVKKREENYRRNLQLLKNAQASSDDIVIERMKIYELHEMEKATDYFDKTRIVGGGGHGNVYKGILSDQRIVAIKKPKITNESELEQFINEVFILSQTSHRNVVKFFGCCLETEVPLLVFEFISGGTLSDHFTDHQQYSPLSFQDRLRVAHEIARALSYIHSEASITIFHRDVKSSNILLDERNIAKLADFGASRVVTCEKNPVTTVVQGTYGYLDPEYHQTGKLTQKSDVYSFGVILAELLTGKAAAPYRKENTMRHLVMDFLDSLKENTLPEILDPIVLNEAEGEIVERMARFVERCLKLSGNERPMMKELEEALGAMSEEKSNANGDANIESTLRIVVY